EGRDLYDGTQAEREVTLTSIPPILQIHVQRVQFDRSTSNVYKSNAFLRFDKVIYLDRYLDKNGDLLRQRRLQANSWKMEIDRLQTTLKENSQDKTTMLNPSSLLRTTADFIKNMKSDYSEFLFDENADWQLSEMEQESIRVTNRISDAEDSITTLRHKLKQHYHDLKECEYHLHAVFIHSGQATFGHYWIYIYDIEKDRWLKYNDSYVTEVEEREVLADTTGSSANPYCMVYVRSKGKLNINTIDKKTSQAGGVCGFPPENSDLRGGRAGGFFESDHNRILCGVCFNDHLLVRADNNIPKKDYNKISKNSTFVISKYQGKIDNSVIKYGVALYATEAAEHNNVKLPTPGKNERDNPKISNLVEQIASLSLIETSELIKLNIQDVALPAVNFASMATAAPTDATSTPEEKAPEKAEFTLKLEKFDPASKTKIIREIKNIIPGTNLVEAKKFVESVPKVIKENVNKEEAEKIKKTLEGLGATVLME
ncbi:5521_t:CDS:10, partial [Entrophospora sp. SA101]